ncbi:glycosyltransferase [Candidatus Peregrinibacteria bacterium]|nr:glycosyltransferase [Candidatus Peregrinibacteria bacterium]
MHVFWNIIIRPLLEILSPKAIVEIGTFEGDNTKNILQYCEEYNCVLHGIDPIQTDEISTLTMLYPKHFVFHKELSLNMLHCIPQYEAILIDGDHNWYTVYHELLLIEKRAKETGTFPLVFVHDIGWPYGKRDMYQDPDLIPNQYLQPYRTGGLIPGEGFPVLNKGLNSDYLHGIYEHGIRSGIQSAVTDFLKATDLQLQYTAIPGFHGLGILASQNMLDEHAQLKCHLNEWQSTAALAEYINTLEKDRIQSTAALAEYINTLEKDRIQNSSTIQQYVAQTHRHRTQTEMLENQLADVRERTMHSEILLRKERQVFEKAIQENRNTLTSQKQIFDKAIQENRNTLEGQLSNVNQVLSRVLKTKSWRWTKGLRWIVSTMRSLRSGKCMYTIFGCLRDLWTDFGEPLPKLTRFIRHNILGKTWPVQMPTETPIAHSARILTPSTFLAKNETSLSKRAVSNMQFHPYIRIVIHLQNFDEILMRRCLNSITEQTYPEWHVTVADSSGSSNVPEQITKEYNQHFPEKFQYIAQKSVSGDVRNFAVHDATEMYISFLQTEDMLQPDALEKIIITAQEEAELPDMIYSDHCEIAVAGAKVYTPAYKPKWSPELLLSYDYIRTFFLIKREIVLPLLQKSAAQGAAYTYDILLRLIETKPHVTHVPIVLYHRYNNFQINSTAVAGFKYVLQEALKRRNLEHSVSQPQSSIESNQLFFQINHHISEKHCPSVTIIIPTKDRIDLLKLCLESIRATTNYPNYEVVVVDNNSEEATTAEYLKTIPETVIRIDTPTFNFAHINNEAVKRTSGELILLLNNDTEPIRPSWLSTMVGTMLLDDNIGVVGSRLLYPKGQSDYRVQSVGMIVGRHWASLVRFHTEQELGYGFYNQVMRNCSAIGGACLLTKRDLFIHIGGLDEKKFCIDFGDVDYCLKVQQEGYRVVCNPQATLVHHESATRGNNDGLGSSVDRHEINDFEKKWGHIFGNDPYYNSHFSLSIDDDAFTPKPEMG